jgi:hypothetical protein
VDDEGKLPNISALAQARRHVSRCRRRTRPSRRRRGRRSPPASTPASTTSTTSSCATRRRTCRTSAWCTRTPPKFLFNYFPLAKPKVTSIRGGTSFWVTAGQQGVRSDILTVPVTFPPEDVENGELLSGLPLPDIRGTMGTFSYYATDLSRYEEGNTEMGGILKRLVFEDDTASSELDGPPSPIVRRRSKRSAARADAQRERPRAARRAAGGAGRPRPVHDPVERAAKWRRSRSGSDHRARAGKWTPWIDLTFKVNAIVRVHGMVQMLLINADNELQLYGLTGQLQARRPAGADVVAGVLLGGSLQGDRQLPHAGLGGSDLGAQREPHGREDVHGRSHGRLRRPRER